MRRIDSVGRVVLPSELRKKLGIDMQDRLEFYVEADMIILKTADKTACVF